MCGFSEAPADVRPEEQTKDQGYAAFSTLPDNVKVQLESSEATAEQQAGDTVIPSDDPYTITVEHADGSRTHEVFADPMRYTDEEGKTQFIDTAMEKTDWSTSLFQGYAYENAANALDVRYPKSADKGLAVDDVFTLVPCPEDSRVNDSAGQPTADTTANGNGRLTYPEAFGEHTYVEYINTAKGFKENIVLEQYTGQNRFDFHWASETHSLVLADDGSIEVVQKNDPTKVDYRFMPLYVYDSFTGDAAPAAKQPGDVFSHRHWTDQGYYELAPQEDGSFIITSVIPEEYLSHPETVYPVIIDPSLSVANTASNIQDSYVMEKTPTKNYGNLDYMSFGYSAGSGKMYAYVQHKTLPSLPSNQQITSAYFKVTFRTGQNTPASMKGSVQRCNASWSETGINWNNKPGATGTAYQVLPTMNGSYLNYYNFDITPIVTGWISGKFPKYGLMFTYQNATYNDYNSVVSSEGDSRMPKLTINTEPAYQTNGIVNNGIYFLKSKYSGLCITAPNSYDNLYQTAKNGKLKPQQWKVKYLSNGYYEFYPMNNTGLRMAIDNSADADQNKVFAYTPTGSTGQKFRIIQNGDGSYRIMPACSKTRVLDVRGPSKNDGTPIQLYTYKNVSQQHWYFDTGVTLNTPQIGQEKDTWCWAACAQMAAKTVGSCSKSQFQLAKEFFNLPNAGYDSPEIEKGLNIQSAYEMMAVTNLASDTSFSYVDQKMTQDELILELNRGNPIILLNYIYFNDNLTDLATGHITVLYGYYAYQDMIHFKIRDPWPANYDVRYDKWPSPNPGQSYERLYNEIVNGPSGLTKDTVSIWMFTVTSRN